MIGVICHNQPEIKPRPDLPRIQGRVQLELVHPVSYTIMGRESHCLTVPDGYLFDGASIPRALCWFATPVDDWLEGALLHDYIYWTRCMTRLAADECLRQLVRQCGHGQTYASIIYRSVRMFGSAAYRSGSAIEARLDSEKLSAPADGIWRRAAWQSEDWSVLEDYMVAAA